VLINLDPQQRSCMKHCEQKGWSTMLNIDYQTLIIIILAVFIVGLMAGVSIARPRSRY
jgi:hypothetical protein